MKLIKIICSTNKQYPKKLLEIEHFPEKLYVEGDYTLLNKMSIGIVGSRKCSQHGYNTSLEFANKLSQNNICIVSGMALGIDCAAHIGSKNNIGKTIAVLGSGFNNIYPPENAELYYSILENNGCIVSEYEPNTGVNLKNFPKRNRIISGLSMGVLVVEARFRSGSSITANYALQQDKKVFCVPSDIHSKYKGTNILIQKGATLVTNVNDIFKEYNLHCNVSEEKVYKPTINRKYKLIYDAVSNIPINVNNICKITNKNITEVMSTLTMLELDGVIKQMPGNEYIRSE